MLILVLISCSKSKIDVVPEPIIEFDFNGVVTNKYSNLPVPGIKVTVYKLQYTSDGNAISKGALITDSKGEFTFRLNRVASHSFEYLIRTKWPGDFDSTKLECKFIDKEFILTEDQISAGKTIISLDPSGLICFYANYSNWNLNHIDSVFITSPYETLSFPNKFGVVNFHVDPSQVNQFSWYYIKNGVKSNTTTKQFFVRNAIPNNYLCLNDTIAF